MIDHLGLRVSDLAASSAFDARALAPLGHCVLMDHDFGVGLAPTASRTCGSIRAPCRSTRCTSPWPPRTESLSTPSTGLRWRPAPGRRRSPDPPGVPPGLLRRLRHRPRRCSTSKSSATRFGERRHANRGVPARAGHVDVVLKSLPCVHDALIHASRGRHIQKPTAAVVRLSHLRVSPGRPSFLGQRVPITDRWRVSRCRSNVTARPSRRPIGMWRPECGSARRRKSPWREAFARPARS
jgi:hypothetical protein